MVLNNNMDKAKKAKKEEMSSVSKKAKTENIAEVQTERMDATQEVEEDTSRDGRTLTEAREIANGENNKNFKPTLKKEIVVFKGKPITVINSNDRGRDDSSKNPPEKKKFDRFHQEVCIVTVTLNTEYCTTRGQSNFLKIIVISEGKYTPDKVIKSGFKSVDVYFDSVCKANNLLSDSRLNTRISCDILIRNTCTRGVISDWDNSTQKLEEAIDNKINVISIERILKRRFNRTDKSTTWCNTSNFIIVFKGRFLLDNISLYNGLVKLKVRPYISLVKQCYNCYRFGHTKAVCRSKCKICIVCSEAFHGLCDRPDKCVNCGGKHKANDRSCEIYLYNKQILKVRRKNMSIYEAKNIIRESSRTGTLNAWTNPEDWPRLGSNSRENYNRNYRQYNGIKNGGNRDDNTKNFRSFINYSCAFIETVTLDKEDEEVFRKFVNVMIQKLTNFAKHQKTVPLSKTGKQDGKKVTIKPSLVADVATAEHPDSDEFY